MLDRFLYQFSRGLDPGWILERKTLSQFLRTTQQGLLLDVACRDGFKSEFFAKRGFQVVGIDIDEASIRRARAIYGGPNRHFVLASADQLPFRTGAFQKASCLHSLTMFESPEAALGEIRRVLVRGAELLVTVASELTPWTNMRKYNIATLRSTMERASFEVVEDCSFVNAPILQWNERLRLGARRGWYRALKLPL